MAEKIGHPIPGGFRVGDSSMNAQVTVTVPSTVTAEQVAEARSAFVNSITSSYGAGRVYAADLVGFFREAGFGDAWLAMAHDAKGASADAMRAERDTLYAALRDAKHSNPSVKWKQIKGYAADLIRAELGESEESESDGEGSDKAKRARSPQLRLIEDLTGLFKMCKREKKTLTPAQSEAWTHITSALDALGVDTSQL